MDIILLPVLLPFIFFEVLFEGLVMVVKVVAFVFRVTWNTRHQ